MVKEVLKKKLDSLKLCDGDSYGAVIERLVDFWYLKHPVVGDRPEYEVGEVIGGEGLGRVGGE